MPERSRSVHEPGRPPKGSERRGSAPDAGTAARKSLPMSAKRLTIQQRKDIFHALVTTQDQGSMSVADSVRHVSQQFEITDSQLRQIQDEGIEKEWPPLDEAVVSG